MHSNSFLECRKIFPERHTTQHHQGYGWGGGEVGWGGRGGGGRGEITLTAVSEGMVTCCEWGWKQNVTNTVNKLWLGDKCVQMCTGWVTNVYSL